MVGPVSQDLDPLKLPHIAPKVGEEERRLTKHPRNPQAPPEYRIRSFQ